MVMRSAEENPVVETTVTESPIPTQAAVAENPAPVPMGSPSPHIGGSYRYDPVTDTRVLVEYTDDPSFARPK